MVSAVARIGNLWNRSPFLSTKSVLAAQEETELVFAIKKKNDAANATAKFVLII